ncbi:MAG TPA: HAMP domain-containing histidine kinase, partial [Syntrophomonadaceae bacterium]|nr:HAMP domain-containing histidine kinase [Syntrophomonadaceae bacterium]
DTADVSAVFTSVKTEQELSAGQEFLEKLGYKEDMDTKLLPQADEFVFKYRLILLLFMVGSAFLLLGAFFWYFSRQQQEIEQAISAVQSFLGGNTSERIESDYEGGLAKLFSSVNTMATSLNTHIEAQKQTKNFLKDSIADISHQLKTPLTALKMYNEIMQEESENPDTIKKFTLKTDDALERMEVLIQNQLKITRLDAGTITFDYKETNLQGLLQNITYSFETRAQREQKTILLYGEKNVSLFCDADWMTEAVSNLVKNALDHTDKNGKIEISWEETPAVTKITIRDNGKGIHPEDIFHIFKRFYRSRFSQDKQGIGLGLSLAKSIVEAHNGMITAESTLGRGSVFKLSFLKA